MVDFFESLFIRGWAGLAGRPQRRARPTRSDSDPSALGYTLTGDESGAPGRPIRLTWAEMLRQVLIVGITGSGKSTLLRRLVESFWATGFASVVSFDIHADLNRNWALPYAAEVLGPDDPEQRLVVVDSTVASQNVPAWNVLTGHGDAYQRAFHLLSVIRQQTREHSGPLGVNVQQDLMFGLLALAEASGTAEETYSLLDMEALFTHEGFREYLTRACSEPVRDYWHRSFGRLSAEEQARRWSAIENKLTPLTLALRPLLGPRRSSITLDILNDAPAKMVLVTLPHHRLEDAAVFGTDLLVSCFHNFVMSRAELPAERKFPVLAIVDEFPTLSTERFESLLALCRKHNVATVLGAQSVGMLPPSTRHILRNVVGNTVAMRSGPDSARELARSIVPRDPDEDVEETLLTFKQGEAYLARVDAPAIKMRVRHAPDPDVSPDQVRAVQEAALSNYGQPREQLARERNAFASRLQQLEREHAIRGGAAAVGPEGEVEIRHDKKPGQFRPRRNA